MKRAFFSLLALSLIASGLALLARSGQKTVLIETEHERIRVRAFMQTVEDALRIAGVPFNPQDNLSPPLQAPIANGSVIHLSQPHQVEVRADGSLHNLRTSERLPANILAHAGIPLFPGDELLLSGTPIPPDKPLPPASRYQIELRRAIKITLNEDGQQRTLYSRAPTLRQALAEAGISLKPDDRLSPPPDTPLNAPLEATLHRAQPLTIQVLTQTLQLRSAAPTVGQALAEVGLPLQALDYSIPPEDAPLPPQGPIRIVQLRDEISFQQETLPFSTLTQPLPDLEIDSTRIVEPGELGLRLRQIRIRYEDGQEISRRTESEWTAIPPKPRILGYGTKIIVRTLNTPNGPIQYWRAVQAYATSYSPCRLGIPNYCNDRTASGLPLRKGVVGVVRSWYNAMAGAQVYIPGYGQATIADIGAGLPSGYWIDLGYADDDFVTWHQNVTVYFLTPVPPSDQILWILP